MNWVKWVPGKLFSVESEIQTNKKSKIKEYQDTGGIGMLEGRAT